MQSTSQKRRKAQLGLEFMWLVMVALLAFTYLFTYVADKNAEAYEEMVSIDALKISETLAYEINIALASGDGYEKEIETQQLIFNKHPYTISTESGLLFLDWENNSVATEILVKNITGELSPGGTYILKNTGGIVNAQQA